MKRGHGISFSDPPLQREGTRVQTVNMHLDFSSSNETLKENNDQWIKMHGSQGSPKVVMVDFVKGFGKVKFQKK